MLSKSSEAVRRFSLSTAAIAARGRTLRDYETALVACVVTASSSKNEEQPSEVKLLSTLAVHVPQLVALASNQMWPVRDESNSAPLFRSEKFIAVASPYAQSPCCAHAPQMLSTSS